MGWKTDLALEKIAAEKNMHQASIEAEERAERRQRLLGQHAAALEKIRGGGSTQGQVGQRQTQGQNAAAGATPQTEEERMAAQEVFFSNPKNMYKTGQMVVNGQNVGSPQYTDDYLAFVNLKNSRYNDEKQAKKDASIEGINRLVAAGAQLPPMSGGGSLVHTDENGFRREESVSGPLRLASMSTGDLSGLMTQMAGQVGQIGVSQAGNKVSSLEKDGRDHLLKVLENTPKTIISPDGVKEIANPEHAKALAAFSSFKPSVGGGGMAAAGGGGMDDRGASYVTQQIPQGPDKIYTRDLDRQRQITETQGVVNAPLAAAAPLPELIRASGNTPGGGTGDPGNSPQRLVIRADKQKSVTPPGILAREGLGPNDPTPIYTSKARKAADRVVGKAFDMTMDATMDAAPAVVPILPAARLAKSGYAAVNEAVIGPITNRLKQDYKRNRQSVKKAYDKDIAINY